MDMKQHFQTNWCVFPFPLHQTALPHKRQHKRNNWPLTVRKVVCATVHALLSSAFYQSCSVTKITFSTYKQTCLCLLQRIFWYMKFVFAYICHQIPKTLEHDTKDRTLISAYFSSNRFLNSPRLSICLFVSPTTKFSWNYISQGQGLNTEIMSWKKIKNYTRCLEKTSQSVQVYRGQQILI